MRKHTAINSMKEVACVLNNTNPTSMDDIGKATGLPDDEVEKVIHMLVLKGLIHYAVKNGIEGYVSQYDPLYEKSLEIYWDRTRAGMEADVRFRRCIGCGKSFWSRSITHLRCRRCNDLKWE